MDDREIIQWEKRLADQVQRGWDNYKHLHIDLSIARIDQSYIIPGEYIYVEESSSVNAVAKIKLNGTNNDALDLEKDVEIETVFIEIFITNDALVDEWLDLVFGINFKYKKKVEGGMNYVDRGNLISADFVVGDFTKDGAWHDLDLSGIIDAGAVLIIAKLYITTDVANRAVRFKNADYANDGNTSMHRTQVANVPFINDLQVPPNANGIIKYKFDAVAWSEAQFTIRGWFV